MKIVLRLASLTPLILSPLALASENVPDHYGYIGGHASYYTFYDNDVIGNGTDGLDDQPFYGGQLGWRFNRNWSVQGWYEEVDGDAESKYNSGRRLDMKNYFASIRYHLDDYSLLGFEPYAGINAGEQLIENARVSGADENDELMTGVELGLQRAFFKHVIFDLGTRHAYSQDREYWEGQIYAGLNLAFGVSNDDKDNAKQERVPAEPAAVVSGDGDGDGVADDVDQCPDSASSAVVDDEGCQVYKMQTRTQTGEIYFEFDRAAVQGQFSDDVRQAADRMNAGDEGLIRVEGHTDSIGPADYNQTLSERRAQAVKDKLINDYSVDASKVSTEGFGESRPVADNSTAEGRAQNRRADIIVDIKERVPEFK
ncbi:outer membrane protein OprF [Alcanivorax hongdengensis A-11-3]|uniref:Outer membrane protein OprF n=1 Tax=Alcanivorax hongdengensis A-11-3 TaxID=1177179 RepID=L0W9D6_9GAMM|nr:OmpA family protein [Alcanivorax hongdengensis]EKF73561.1 outer membrane protein OprF [Alcanivorax hongdengensis A-11-3]